MKKLAIFISLISLMACEDKIINLSPVSELTSENFYETEVDFQNALISAYDVLQEKNEIDYFFVSENLRKQVKNAWILSEVPGSDHCPIGLSITI